MQVQDRFLLYVSPCPLTGCWWWTGGTTRGGYGAFWLGPTRGLTRANRASFEIFKGPLREGMNALHTCDQTACVNPAHLFEGTQADNMRDMAEKHRHPGPGLAGERSPTAKLTESDVLEIRRAAGGVVAIAEQFGVSKSLVSAIRLRAAWRHVA